MPVLGALGGASARALGRGTSVAVASGGGGAGSGGITGQQAYTTPGTYSWVAPAGVTSVSVVAIGGFTESFFINASTVRGGGGSGGAGTFTGDGGGNGGSAGSASPNDPSGWWAGGGGGGAGGYTSAGGNGGNGSGNSGIAGHSRGAPGGGTGIFGGALGGSGGAGGVGDTTPSVGGAGGSGGTAGSANGSGGTGGNYGGGAGFLTSSGASHGGGLGWKNNIAVTPGTAYTVVVGGTGSDTNAGLHAGGAVRIIWGAGRAFPSTNTGDVSSGGGAGAYASYPTLYQTVTPFTGAAVDPATATIVDASTPYPVVSYNGTQWLLAYQFGTDASRFGGLRRYTSSNANLSSTNQTVPTQSNPIQSDWTSAAEDSSFSFAGYKDNDTNGANNIYANHPYLASMSNKTASSSTRVWIPSSASQTLIVFADFYRSDGGISGSSRPTITGRSWNGGNFTIDMIASWRGTQNGGTAYGLNSTLSNGDMCITTNSNVGSPMMLYVLEAGYTISTIGFVMFKPLAGTAPSPTVSSSITYSGSAQDFTMAQLEAYGIGWIPSTESFFSLDGNAHNITFTERITNFSGNPSYRETYNQTRTVPSTGTLALGFWIGTPVGIRATAIT